MHGMIFNINHYAIHDGPGIRTTVFFQGCPMRCLWCHNPEGQDSVCRLPLAVGRWPGAVGREPLTVGRSPLAVGREEMPDNGKRQTANGKRSSEEILREIEKDKVFYEESGGGVTFSGGESLMQPEFLEELLDRCREKGYHTAIDTCGFAPSEVMKKMIGKADLFLYDIKLMDDARHKEYTGVSNEPVIRNLETIARAGKEVVIRLPVIPGITDGMENIRAIAGLMDRLGLKRIDLLPYHRIAKGKYEKLGWKYLLPDLEESGKEELEKISGLFKKHGFIVGIGG